MYINMPRSDSDKIIVRKRFNGGRPNNMKRSPNSKQGKKNYVISQCFNGGSPNRKRSPNSKQSKKNYVMSQHFNGGFNNRKRSPNNKQGKKNYVISQHFNGGFNNRKTTPLFIKQPKSIITGGVGLALTEILNTFSEKKTDRNIRDAVRVWAHLQWKDGLSWFEWLKTYFPKLDYSPIHNLRHTVHISNWDVSEVTNMVLLFANAENWHETSRADPDKRQWTKWDWDEIDLSKWNTSNVTDMGGMFQNNPTFNCGFMRNWDVGNVTNMSYMFADCENFNQPLDRWDLGKVENMNGMFENSPQFSSRISPPAPFTWIEYMFGDIPREDFLVKMVQIGWGNIPQMEQMRLEGENLQAQDNQCDKWYLRSRVRQQRSERQERYLDENDLVDDGDDDSNHPVPRCRFNDIVPIENTGRNCLEDSLSLECIRRNGWVQPLGPRTRCYGDIGICRHLRGQQRQGYPLVDPSSNTNVSEDWVNENCPSFGTIEHIRQRYPSEEDLPYDFDLEKEVVEISRGEGAVRGLNVNATEFVPGAHGHE